MSYTHVNSKGRTYYLHSQRVASRGGGERQIYFFANQPGLGALDALPEGYVVSEAKSGLPVLKKAQPEVVA